MRTIKASGLTIARTKRIFWTPNDAAQFYGEHQGRFYFPRLVRLSRPDLSSSSPSLSASQPLLCMRADHSMLQ